MVLTTAYLTSTKNLSKVLTAIQNAQAPEKFTSKLLEDLSFKSSADRLIIGVLKALRFIDDTGKPTDRYFEYLDVSRSKAVMASGIRDAYGDLFRINKDAHKLSREEIKNKFKTLSQGRLSESVLNKMASTYTALVKHADFAVRDTAVEDGVNVSPGGGDENHKDNQPRDRVKHAAISGLVYNIQIHLPETRDMAVYDALFRSLKEHLL